MSSKWYFKYEAKDGSIKSESGEFENYRAAKEHLKTISDFVSLRYLGGAQLNNPKFDKSDKTSKNIEYLTSNHPKDGGRTKNLVKPRTLFDESDDLISSKSQEKVSISTPGQSPTSPTAELTLMVESESGTPEEYFVQRGLTIGRASSNTIVIDHPDLDRIHARVLLEEDGVFRLACEPQAPRLQILEPEPGEVEKVELSPGLALIMGGITIRCRRQVRGMMGISDDYWADAAGGERFQVETEGFKGALPKKIGPYEIRKFVARGGMGVVLQGIHESTAQPAAVKLPTPDLNKDEQWLKRFEQEVRTLKSVTHPNLVRLQDAGKEGGLHWMAMDWVEGWTAAERLTAYRKAGNPVPLSEIQQILQQVVAGLKYLHSHNVVHRDLKPGNLLVGQDGSVKVADFGLAKQVGTEQNTALTRTGTMAGTMHYMAPEQAEGLEVTTATDIYALGIIWHELLTGKRPGGGRLKLQRFRSDSPAAWESVMEDCLDREAAERPGLDAIRQALESVALKSEIEKEEKGAGRTKGEGTGRTPGG